MARLIVAMTGSGVPKDPYGVALPTAVIASVDYIGMRAVIDVPDDDAPDAADQADYVVALPSGERVTYKTVRPGASQRWRAKLSTKYGDRLPPNLPNGL